MIKVLDSTKKNFNFYFDSIIKRRKNRTKNISSIVRKIIDDVKKNGDKALLKYEKRYNSNSSIIPNPKKIKKAILVDNIKSNRFCSLYNLKKN